MAQLQAHGLLLCQRSGACVARAWSSEQASACRSRAVRTYNTNARRARVTSRARASGLRARGFWTLRLCSCLHSQVRRGWSQYEQFMIIRYDYQQVLVSSQLDKRALISGFCMLLAEAVAASKGSGEWRHSGRRQRCAWRILGVIWQVFYPSRQRAGSPHDAVLKRHRA